MTVITGSPIITINQTRPAKSRCSWRLATSAPQQYSGTVVTMPIASETTGPSHAGRQPDGSPASGHLLTISVGRNGSDAACAITHSATNPSGSQRAITRNIFFESIRPHATRYAERPARRTLGEHARGESGMDTAARYAPET